MPPMNSQITNTTLDHCFTLFDLEKDATIADADNSYKYLNQMIRLMNYDDGEKAVKLQELKDAHKMIVAFLKTGNKSVETADHIPSDKPGNGNTDKKPIILNTRTLKNRMETDSSRALLNAKKAKQQAEQAKSDAVKLEQEADIAVKNAEAQKDLAKQILAEAEKDRNAAVKAMLKAERAFEKSEQLLEEKKALYLKAEKAKKITVEATHKSERLMEKTRKNVMRSVRHDPLVESGDKPVNSALKALSEIEKTLNRKKHQRFIPIFKSPGVCSPEKPTGKLEKRSGIRVVYPPEFRPDMMIEGKVFPVHDISAKGIRILNHENGHFGRIVRGSVILKGKQPITIIGKLIRKSKDGLALNLATRISNMEIQNELNRIGHA